MTNANPAIEARGLGKRYGRRWALADCTLAIPAGHVAGLVGPNGAGKTTLISLATGMLAHQVTIRLSRPAVAMAARPTRPSSART